MSVKVTREDTDVQKRFFTMSDVLTRVNSAGITIDEETVEYHLYRTKKMPRPAKKVKRERYWTAEQIELFIAEL